MGQTTLFPRGSVWKFYYNGPVPTNWNQTRFDDHSWPSGPAQLGYGEGDERTVMIDDPGYEPTACYFRSTFVLTNSLEIGSLTLRLVADDGAVVYLNGSELARRNMPAGPVTYQTTALKNIETNENSFVQFGVPISALVNGTNWLAVEVHQHTNGLDDCSFDLELVANVPLAFPRVSIVSPADGAIVSTQALRIDTVASDADGYVAGVAFYTNDLLLGVTSEDPFSFIWTNPPVGRYSLTAYAYDDVGWHWISEIVRIQVGDVSDPLRLLRGPYLQSASATNIVIRWRTDWVSDSIVHYGTNAGFLDSVVTNLQMTGEHQVNLTGLQPDETYFYSIGSTAQTLKSGPELFFHTSPTNAQLVRIWAIGDSGTADMNAAAVRDAYAQSLGGNHCDVWLMLGDNAYGDGTDIDYQRAVFQMYTNLLPQTVLWPALGNHDAGDTSIGSKQAYLDMFTLPTRAEAGGVPSGTELYYSYDYANIHFVCLDSFVSDRATNGPMLTWLKNDLETTDKDWIVAYWHHPPYSWGTHNSDTEPESIEMRERALPILEAYGVDLVLSGHSHNYERSVLADGHYGYSWEFLPTMALDAGLGRCDAGGCYRKPAGGIGAHRGAVYTVCGCSGEGGGGQPTRQPIMAVTQGGYGSMVIEIDHLQLNARFLRPSGDIDDYFTIDKSAPITNGPPLEIAQSINGPVISWPTSISAFSLEWTTNLPSAQWNAAVESKTTIGRRNSVALSETTTNRFFRLRSTSQTR